MLKKLLLLSLFSMCLVSPTLTFNANAEGSDKKEFKKEKHKHPRLAKSIKELEETISFLEKAPHDFGGHKASAIDACKKAIEELKKALEFRAKEDDKKGKK